MRIFKLLFPILVFFSCSKKEVITPDPPASPDVAKGIFGLRDASLLTGLEAAYTRILVWDTDIEAIYNQVDNGMPLASIQQYQQVKSIFDSGVKIILTFRWPDQNSSDPSLYDRVPVGQDRIDAIDLLKRFLIDFGPLLEMYSIQNEVGGLGPGTYSESDMQTGANGIPAIEWWKELVTVIEGEKTINAGIAHLKLSSPTPVLLKRMVFDPSGLPQTNIDFFYETIAFGNQFCDYIDFHFNTYTLAEYASTLDFLAPLVTVPMICTEWSEVGSANIYKEKPISSELRSYADSIGYLVPSTIISNDDLIHHLYAYPGTLELWKYMVDESAYHVNFMAESSKLLAESGFEILCWNSGWQEGLTAYDLRSFYATKTVAGQENEVTTLIDEFKNL